MKWLQVIEAQSCFFESFPQISLSCYWTQRGFLNKSLSCGGHFVDGPAVTIDLLLGSLCLSTSEQHQIPAKALSCGNCVRSDMDPLCRCFFNRSSVPTMNEGWNHLTWFIYKCDLYNYSVYCEHNGLSACSFLTFQVSYLWLFLFQKQVMRAEVDN